MNRIAFDTLNYSKALRDAGMPLEQAEAFTEAQKAVIAEIFAMQDLAKQSDVMRLEAKIEETRLELEAKVEETRHELDAKVELTRLEVENTRIGLEAKIEETRLGLEAKIEETRHELDAKIEDTRLEIEKTKHELEAKIGETKHDLLKWMIGLAFAQMALVTTLLTVLR